ncbi:sulfate adenylyltransferase subunit 1 [Blattabacterium cuenoti]|uniref:sulfate adenylyltransferase subunit 1 n=1 Tax=Blattabacterium cuenoti TaxID=1653831 RepID=UPI00163BAF5B|nr:GTP-binding protein [Blattabacterium cuenoti]
MNTLRFMTSGSVDNGKSTLIGRLLYDSNSILMDQLNVVKKRSLKKNNNNDNNIDLSLFTDGLRAEREQGITIDVAYKYFATPNRKFIIADVPGHIQYTRNMVTGATHVDLAIILIDARYGIVEQTQRHSLILGILNIPKIILAINKMDLINYDKSIYQHIVNEYKNIAKKVGLKNVTTIPISAKNGDNIVNRSKQMKWYTGPTLLYILENTVIHQNYHLEPSRYPVQYVIICKKNNGENIRGYAGKIISGTYKEGDKVIIYPSKFQTSIKYIENGSMDQKIQKVFYPQSIVMYLEDEIDISRGDLIVKKEDIHPTFSKEFEVILCWMTNNSFKKGNKYLFQINSLVVTALIKEIIYRIDANNLKVQNNPENIQLNDLVKAKIRTSIPIPYDSYNKIRDNGASILIDDTNYSTVASCMIQ